MRKILIVLMLMSFAGMKAQNVQLHYDFGHSLYEDLSNRPSATTTVEMFKPDRWGSTFLFTDIDYFHDGAAGAYWEISRELNIWRDNNRWAFHVEYNGGLESSLLHDKSTRFQHAVLAGGAWNWSNVDFTRTLSFQALYKYYFKGQNPWNRPFNSFQATAVWGMQLANRLLSFSGFIDCWYDQSVRGHWVVLSEPQLWLNIYAMHGCSDVRLSIGTEVEISNNFVFDKNGRNDRFYAIPTLAAKWTF